MLPSANQMMSSEMKTASCVVVKNESEMILEWIAYHLNLGFDTVFIIDDDSEDDTKEIALRAGRHADVRVSDYGTKEKEMQGEVYATLCRENRDFDWIAFIDCDEFLVTDKASIKDELSAVDAEAVAVNWLMFGSSGHVAKPEGLTIANYTRRAQIDFGPNRHVKTIIRPQSAIRGINPHCFEIEGSYVTADGTPVAWERPGLIATPARDRGLRLNHYFTRSWVHWEKRMARGQLGKTVRTAEDFHKYDRNEVEDRSAAERLGATAHLMSTLRG